MSKIIIPQDLKPYLRYSAALHGAIALWLALVFLRSQPHSNDVYTIDIVGPASSSVESRSAAQTTPSQVAVPQAPAGHMEEHKTEDEFTSRRHRRNEALPAPSLLEGYQNVSTAKTAPSAAAAPAPSSASSGAPGAVSMELSDFPYPWYISQIRMALWNQWSSRMPSGGGRCVVSFSILSDGNIVDLRTEESSGDAGFDLTALGAVKDAAPFPPLPPGFKKPFLAIHLTLTSS